MEPAALRVMLDTFWVLLAGFLVFFMNLGFAMVESGLCRVKNTVNILAKNFVVFAVSSLAYYFLGFGLMYGDGNALFGTQGLLAVAGPDNSPQTGAAYLGAYSALSWTGVPLWAKFFFQLVFCGTAATIVSGAVAEPVPTWTRAATLASAAASCGIVWRTSWMPATIAVGCPAISSVRSVAIPIVTARSRIV